MMPQLTFTSDKGDWPPNSLIGFTEWLRNRVPESEREKARIDLRALSDYENTDIVAIKISY